MKHPIQFTLKIKILETDLAHKILDLIKEHDYFSIFYEPNYYDEDRDRYIHYIKLYSYQGANLKLISDLIDKFEDEYKDVEDEKE